MRRKNSDTFDETFSILFHDVPIYKMPDDVWLRYAWMQSVDHETFQNSVIVSAANGILVVRCTSAHAAQTLENPSPVLRKWNALNLKRPLPKIEQIRVLLGRIDSRNHEPMTTFQPDPVEVQKYSDLVEDPMLGSLLAKLASKNHIK